MRNTSYSLVTNDEKIIRFKFYSINITGLDINSYLMLECFPMMKQAPAHPVNIDNRQNITSGCTSTAANEYMRWALGVCNIMKN